MNLRLARSLVALAVAPLLAVGVAGVPDASAASLRTPTPKQSGVLSAPALAPVGPVKITARFDPVVAGRTVRVEARKGTGGWATLATGKENKRGVATITVQATGAGRYTFRAVAAKVSGHAAVATPERTITITSAAQSSGTVTRVLDGADLRTFVSSADGRYVAYSADEGGYALRYRDRQTGSTTTITSVLGAVVESISADGEVVSFRTQDDSVAPGGTPCASPTVDCYKIYVWHRSTGAITRITDGGRGLSYFSRLSADGTQLAFYSEAHGLVPGDTTTTGQIYVAAVSTGKLTQVTHGDNFSDRPDISADGRYVVFYSAATNLVPGETSSDQAAYLYDRVSGRTTRVSATGVNAYHVQVSGDGSKLAYSGNNSGPVVLLDRTSGSRVSLTDESSVPGDLAISQDGRWVVSTVTGAPDADNTYPPSRLVAFDTTRAGAPTTIATAQATTNGSLAPLDWVGSRFLPFVADGTDAGADGGYLWTPPTSS